VDKRKSMFDFIYRIKGLLIGDMGFIGDNLQKQPTRKGRKPQSGVPSRGARDSRVVSRSDYETRRKVIVGKIAL